MQRIILLIFAVAIGLGGVAATHAEERKQATVAAVPEWSPGREEALPAILSPDAGESARPHVRSVHPWETGGRRLLAVLIDEPCGEGACVASVGLAIFEMVRGAPVLVARLSGIASPGEGGAAAFDPELRMTPTATLLAVRESETREGAAHGTLRLYLLDGAELRKVFERTVQDFGCEASIVSDEFGAFPYPLRITERCTNSRRTSTEVWRWEQRAYVLHGPASDAARSDAVFSTDVDEPRR